MSRIRVLQVVPSLVQGGAERMAVQLSTALDPVRFDVEVLSLYGCQQTDLERLLDLAHISVRYLHKHSGLDGRIFGAVCRAARRFRPDILHTHMHAFNYAIPAILLGIARNAVHTIHSIADRERQRLGSISPRFLFARSVTPVAVAGEVQASIKRVFGCPSLLIPNGIPLERFQKPLQSRLQWRQQEGFAGTDLLLTCVGRFDPIKNHALLIEAFARGPASITGTHLLLAGGGPLEPALRAQVERAGIQRQVRFLGLRSDVPELLNASDAFVFASDSEASPLSVMESMAAGLPVCGTKVGGVPELVQSEQEGILVPPRSVDLLARSLVRICIDDSERAAMGRAAAAKAPYFDTRLMVDAYGKLYEALAHGHHLSIQ